MSLEELLHNYAYAFHMARHYKIIGQWPASDEASTDTTREVYDHLAKLTAHYAARAEELRAEILSRYGQ